MVLCEVKRNQAPTSDRLAQWVFEQGLLVMLTQVGKRYQQALGQASVPSPKSNLGELAFQSAMNEFALSEPPKTAIFLFEDHKIARASFLVPGNCRKLST
jgi:hypothetical protein